jgi:spore maturation protein CgeB
LHHGKVALCFLRKINRDRITQRTMEIAAMGRPMLAEKTDEHDDHFLDGEEYLGFTTDEDLVAKARALLADAALRKRMGERGRERCLVSGYSSDERARQMVESMGFSPIRP